MLRSLTVENFRCFRKLELPALDRVNLIAGKNNTGKTALLEAIWLHCHPAYLPSSSDLHKVRGAHSTDGDEDLNRWFFPDQDTDSPVTIASRNEEALERKTVLEMYSPDQAQSEPYASFEKRLQESLRPEQLDPQKHRIVMRYQDSNRGLGSAVGIGGFRSGRFLLHDRWEPRCHFLRFQSSLTETDNILFSALEAAGRQEEVISPLKLLEPRLQRLALLLLAKTPTLHGQIEGKNHMLPVFLMGDGLNRLLSILLSVANATGGFVLIDEAENGLHHSVLVPVWKAIAQAARKANAQVFATTHSYECIQAAHQAFADSDPYDLRLIRLDRMANDIKAVTYDQRSLGTSLEMSYEVR
jgi:predicted ATP-dependent endonuclease of OLD family